jgi:serine/threonine protein kinase
MGHKSQRVAMEMFNAVKTLHEHNLVHRDVKPDNFRVKNG